MAIKKKPAPEFLEHPQPNPESPVKKPKGFFHKREGITQEDPKQKEIARKNEELIKKASESVFETSHQKQIEVYRGPYFGYETDTITVIEHKLTDFGKQYVFENDELYWQLPEHFRTDSMRAEMALYRPDLLRVEGFTISDKQLLAAIVGPIPEGLPAERIAEIENSRSELLRDGILNEIDMSFEKLGQAIEYCLESKNVSPEFRKWLQDADRENNGYVSNRIEYEVKSMLKGDGNPKYYEKVCQDFKAVYPDVDFKEFEKELWIKNITSERMLSPFAIEKLKELGIDAPHLMVAKDLQTVCDRIKNFVIENNLGVEYQHYDGYRIDSINQRSMSICDKTMAKITLASEHTNLSFNIALTQKIGFSEGSVHTIAHLSDKQFNTWMTEALERACLAHKNTTFIIDKELEKEPLPKDIHPAISIQERRKENPHYLTMEERKILNDARAMENSMKDYERFGKTESYEIEEKEEDGRDRKD